MMNFMAFFYLKIVLQAQGKHHMTSHGPYALGGELAAITGKPKKTNPHNLEQQSKEWLKSYDAGLGRLEAYSRFFNAV